MNKNMNFWNEFIDVKCENLEMEIEAKRKDSLFIVDNYNDSKIETSLPCQSLLNDSL